MRSVKGSDEHRTDVRERGTNVENTSGGNTVDGTVDLEDDEEGGEDTSDSLSSDHTGSESETLSRRKERKRGDGQFLSDQLIEREEKVD